MGLSDADGKRHAQHPVFACVSQLKHRFNQRGRSENDFWNAVKVDLGVESRSEIDEVCYVCLVVRLQTAEKHMHMFKSLCRELKAK